MAFLSIKSFRKESKKQRGILWRIVKKSRRSRHRSSQMNALSKGRFSGKGSKFGL